MGITIIIITTTIIIIKWPVCYYSSPSSNRLSIALNSLSLLGQLIVCGKVSTTTTTTTKRRMQTRDEKWARALYSFSPPICARRSHDKSTGFLAKFRPLNTCGLTIQIENFPSPRSPPTPRAPMVVVVVVVWRGSWHSCCLCSSSHWHGP